MNFHFGDWFGKIAYNVPRLGAGAEKKVQKFNLAQLQAKPLDVAKLIKKSIYQAVFATKKVQKLSLALKPLLRQTVVSCRFFFTHSVYLLSKLLQFHF